MLYHSASNRCRLAFVSKAADTCAIQSWWLPRLVRLGNSPTARKTDQRCSQSSQVPLTGMGVCVALATYGGMGRHVIFARNLPLFAKVGLSFNSRSRGNIESQGFIVAEVCYACTIMLTKLSILFLYHRIFPSKQLKLVSIAIATLVLAYSLALVIVAFVQCIPLSMTWTPTEHGTCIDTKPPYTTTALSRSLQCANHCWCPQGSWMLWPTSSFCLYQSSLYGDSRWKQPANSRSLVYSYWEGCKFWLLSSLVPIADLHRVCIFGFIRAVAVGTVSKTDQTCKSNPALNRNDLQLTFVGSGVEGAIWSQVEMATGTIGACLPTLRPLFTKAGPQSQTDYINKDVTFTVKSGGPPPESVQLSDRFATRKVWAGNNTSMHSDGSDQRPFVRLDGSDGARTWLYWIDNAAIVVE